MEEKELQDLLGMGFSMIPIKPRDKIAAGAWAQFQDRHATADEMQVWKTQGFVNFAVVTGEISGVIVVDIDNQEAYESVAQLGLESGIPTVSTGKGYHLYFAYPHALKKELGKVRNAVNLSGIAGLDIRADGGYVLGPGSIHPSGRPYRWHTTPTRDDSGQVVFPEIPSWLNTMLVSRTLSPEGKAANHGGNAASGAKVADLGNTHEIRDGGRNAAMMRIAGSLRGRGRTYLEVFERLVHENQRCVPPLSHAELRTIAESASRYAITVGDYHKTESGNALRFVDMFGDDLIFSKEHGKWFSWDGTRWVVDNGDNVLTYTQQVPASIMDDSDKVSDPKIKTALATWALKSEELKKLKACVAIAKPKLAVSSSVMDRNHWILNCPNGMVDLQTGELLPHDRKEYCTRMAGTEYHAHAECPRWLAFIDEITIGDEELQRYLQRIVGYSLTGDTSEHVWFMLLGNGRNGKSTFLNAIQAMLSDYSSNIRPEALLMQGMDKVPNDLAALKGSRFVASSEMPASRKLNESLVKQLTGGDKIQARFLHKEFFEFTPMCKLILATNYRPNIQGTDIGIWRRTHEVPFNAVIPESQVDPNLQNKLHEELPGILAWAVRGCMEWQRTRLRPPVAVQEARAEYYEEMDTVGQFLREFCEVAPMPQHSDKRESAKSLYDAFAYWAATNSEEVITKKQFGIKLTQRGIPAARMNDGGRGRQGIKLLYHEIPNPNGRGHSWAYSGPNQ